MTANFNHFNPLAQSYFISSMWQGQRTRKINSLMKVERLSSSFLTFHQALSLYLLSEDAKYLFHSKVSSDVTSPFIRIKLIHLKHIRIHVILQPTCAVHRCYLILCARECTPCHPAPCLFLKTYSLVHLHFFIWVPAKKPYENDRTARKNDDFIV